MTELVSVTEAVMPDGQVIFVTKSVKWGCMVLTVSTTVVDTV